MKLIVISICKDEQNTIGEVLDRIPTSIAGIAEIDRVVIDDGSIDKTANIAEKHGARVFSDGVQKRLAFRFQQAVDIALASGAGVMVNIDGDLQFNPSDIPKLVKPIIDDKADFVAANRFINPKTNQNERPKNMPIGKYLGNKVGAKIVGDLSGQKFSDVTCGFRAYNRDALLALNINSNYTYTQESFQVLAMKKMRIESMPVTVKYYPGRKSRVVQSFFKFLFGSAVNILRAYRDYAPLKFFGRLGAIIFAPGILLVVFVVVHWQRTGLISPYKAFGIAGLYLITLAFVIWVMGLVADMLDRSLGNQEKILEELKRAKYSKK